MCVCCDPVLTHELSFDRLRQVSIALLYSILRAIAIMLYSQSNRILLATQSRIRLLELGLKEVLVNLVVRTHPQTLILQSRQMSD